jgi:hypothetical protein
MKSKGLVGLVVWYIIAVGFLPYFVNSILPPIEANGRIVSLQMYVKEGCPFAQAVIPKVITWQQQYENIPLYFLFPTSQFPSPTLRMKVNDYYENYIGENAIKNAIISNQN